MPRNKKKIKPQEGKPSQSSAANVISTHGMTHGLAKLAGGHIWPVEVHQSEYKVYSRSDNSW